MMRLIYLNIYLLHLNSNHHYFHIKFGLVTIVIVAIIAILRQKDAKK